MNFISCAKWIKKGVAKSDPERVELTQEELQKIISSAREQLKELGDEDDEEMEQDEVATASNTGDEYNFETYDNEPDKEMGISNLIVNADDEKNNYEIIDDDHDSEEEDDKIKPTDNLIAVGHIEGDASILEIFVYNEQDGDMYVHHDIVLPMVPLCLEWLNFEPTDPKPGNLLAVGGMSPVIDVWDLDIIDCLHPAYQLGKSSNKKRKNKSHGHTDAVLDLAWNKSFKHILASGSVDTTLLLWDLDIGRAANTFTEFTDKVQSIKWRPNDNQLLAAGSADKTAKSIDCRSIEIATSWQFKEEIEKIVWCPWDNNLIYFGTNGGNILSYDLRQTNKKIWKVKAHEKEITGLELDPKCPNILFSSAMDELVKIWDIDNNSKATLKSVKSFGLGEIQCIDLNPDSPYVACVGGTKKNKNFKVANLQHEMLQAPNNDVVNTNPVTFGEPLPGSSNSNFNNETLTDFTENAFKSLTINKKKTFKSKKKYGHNFKRN